MPSPIRRWLLTSAPYVSAAGVIALFFALEPFAHAALPQSTPQTWGTRDFITLLITLLVTVFGAFFAGAKRELERMVTQTQDRVIKLEASLAQHEDEVDGLVKLLLTSYSNKTDIADRFNHLDAMIAREMGMLNRRLDMLNVPRSNHGGSGEHN